MSSRLIEAIKRPVTTVDISPRNIDLPKHLDLLPHPNNSVENTPPLGFILMQKMRALSTRESIWTGVDKNQIQRDILAKLINKSRVIEPRFLAFDTTRHFIGTTGYEGYGAGQFENAQDLAEAIAKLGVGVLERIKQQRTAAGDFLFMGKLWKFILHDVYDEQVAKYMYEANGALIAQLKANTANNKEVDYVRNTVVEFACQQEPIAYKNVTESLRQQYTLPKSEVVKNKLTKKGIPTGQISPDHFRGRPEYWGYVFMLKLGMTGHSLVRTAIHEGLMFN